MGRKRKDLVQPVEPGNVLEGVVLNQQTPDTWAVQFRFNAKPCSKLLYGTKQTAAAVRELVAIWLCYKASDAAAVATELQQLQHSYEHYSFLIEALKHSRGVEALWKIVGKFCRGEFEIRSAVRPGLPRPSADESTARSPGGARMAAGPSVGEGDVSSQGAGVGLGGAEACDGQPSGLTNDAGTSSQGAPPADGQCVQMGDGALSSAAGLHSQHYQQEQEGLAEGAALDAAAAAAAASAAAGMVADPAAAAAAMAAAAAAGFSANAAAALQAAFLYAQQRGADTGMLPVLWQQPFAGMQMQLGYSPAGLAVHYAAEAVLPEVQADVPTSEALPEPHSEAAAEGQEASASGQLHLQDGHTAAGQSAVEPEEAAKPAAFGAAEALQVVQAERGLQYSQHLQHEQQRQEQQQQQQNGYGEAYGGDVKPEQQQQQHASAHTFGCFPEQGAVELAQQPGLGARHAQSPPQQPAENPNLGTAAEALAGQAAAPAAAAATAAKPPPQVPAAVGEVLAVVPQEMQQQLLAAAAGATTGDSSADAAAQGLLLWWHTVAGGYGTNPALAVAGAAAEEAPYCEAPTEHQQPVVGQSPKRQRTD